MLDEPVLPEPPRHGEAGADDCNCTKSPDERVIWTDGQWVVRHMGEPGTVPTVMLSSVGHFDLSDMPAEVAATMGTMIQRLERAVLSLGGLGRVHINRWGDGGAHFHMWFFGRPIGMMQLRGTCLPLWRTCCPTCRTTCGCPP
ncbi:hypothetical protein ACFQX7_39665 [Luedemannella flava]